MPKNRRRRPTLKHFRCTPLVSDGLCLIQVLPLTKTGEKDADTRRYNFLKAQNRHSFKGLGSVQEGWVDDRQIS